MSKRKSLPPWPFAIIAAVSLVLAHRSFGVVLFVLLGIALVTGLLFLRGMALRLKCDVLAGHLAKLTLSAGTVAVCFVLFETALRLQHQLPGHDAKTIPEEWKRRDVEVEGAKSAYYWHGKLHVLNEVRMRRTTPFPQKRQDVCRILVLGDSLTYGAGVAVEEAYADVLQRTLEKTHRVECLNLGISGNQSEDTLAVLREYVPALQPELVIYGVCINDFLPSGIGEYQTNRAYAVPLPEVIKGFFNGRSRTGLFLADGYDQVLMSMGLRTNFFTDILKDFANYQTRFARDVKAMSIYMKEAGLPPIVGLVLFQHPVHGSPGNEICAAAEKHLREAAFDVIPSADYLAAHDGRSLTVSRWELHPSGAAHQIYAETLAKHLLTHERLNDFRIQSEVP